jgi:hypothetical protein
MPTFATQMNTMRRVLLLCAFSIFLLADVKAQASAEELAKKLANPVSSLISVPIQVNSDYGIGPLKGSRTTVNVQPVVPMSLTKDFNLIARWVQPMITQYNITGEAQKQGGLADAVVSAFISPKDAKNGFTWGVGPVLTLPIATNEVFASKQLGFGPTAVALKQSNGWTYGALINQVWGIAGGAARAKINQMYFQPFLNYNWKSGAGAGGGFEFTQNWTSNTSTLWFIPTISGLTSLGKQKVSLAFGPRFNLAAPKAGKADMGWRASAALLFPK